MFNKTEQTTIKELSCRNERASVQTFWLIYIFYSSQQSVHKLRYHSPVPYTLQTFFVLLGRCASRKTQRAASMGLYLILGAIGMPIFSGVHLGSQESLVRQEDTALFSDCSFCCRLSLRNSAGNFWWMMVFYIIGSFIIFSIGTIQLNIIYVHNWVHSVQGGISHLLMVGCCENYWCGNNCTPIIFEK